jgi:hypothetical protein
LLHRRDLLNRFPARVGVNGRVVRTPPAGGIKDGFTASFRECAPSRHFRRSPLFPSIPAMSRKFFTVAFVLPLALGLAANAWAGPPHGKGGGKGGTHQPAATPLVGPVRGRGRDELSDSVRRVERDTRGRVLSAERVPYDGRDVNRIKVVDQNGRVRVIMDDPDKQQPPPSAPARGDDN